MGTLSIPVVMAPIFGPVIGGLLLEHAGWRWIFFVNLPFGLVAVPLARWLLPRAQSGAQSAGSRLPDVPGLLLISAGSVAVTYGLASAGSQTIRVVLPVVVGVVLLAAFVVRSARIARPLLDVRLYKNQAYAASSLVNFALGDQPARTPPPARTRRRAQGTRRHPRRPVRPPRSVLRGAAALRRQRLPRAAHPVDRRPHAAAGRAR
jgi:MFS family permease